MILSHLASSLSRTLQSHFYLCLNKAEVINCLHYVCPSSMVKFLKVFGKDLIMNNNYSWLVTYLIESGYLTYRLDICSGLCKAYQVLSWKYLLISNIPSTYQSTAHKHNHPSGSCISHGLPSQHNQKVTLTHYHSSLENLIYIINAVLSDSLA